MKSIKPQSNPFRTHARASADPTAMSEATAESAATWVDISALHAWKDNPRKNDGEPVRKVAASIKRFGFASPIIARRNGEIIAGHTRWKAAQSLKLERVPVRYLDLDPADAHLLAIADNRVAEEASWDEDVLAAVLADLKAQGVDVASSGFSDDELMKLLDEDLGGADDESDQLRSEFIVLVTCRDEMHQVETIEQLQALGHEVKALF